MPLNATSKSARRRGFARYWLLTSCVILAAPIWRARADDTDRRLDVDSLKQRLESAKAESGTEYSQQLVDLYTSAIAAAEAATSQRDASRRFAKELTGLQQRVSDAQARLSTSDEPDLPGDDVLRARSPEDLEGEALAADQKLNALTSQLAKQEEDLKIQRGRPQAIGELKTAATQMLSKIAEELDALSTSTDPAPVIEARRDLLSVRQSRRAAELEALNQELLGCDLRLALKTAERDQTARDVAAQRALAQGWNDLVVRKRESNASKTREEAEKRHESVDQLPLELATMSPTNVELGRELEALVANEKTILARFKNVSAQLVARRTSYKDAQERLEKIGLTDTMSQLLLQKRRALEDPAWFRKQARIRRDLLTVVVGGQIGVDRRLIEVTALEHRLPELVAGKVATGDANRMRVVEELSHDFVKERRALLLSLQQGYARLSQKLGDLDFHETQYESASTDFRRFIEKHLLWIRSRPAVRWSDVREFPKSIRLVVDPSNWQRLGSDVYAAAKQSLPLWVAFALLIIIGRVLRRRALRAFDLFSQPVRRAATDRYHYTLIALLWTAVLAAEVAATPLFVGWQLGALTDVNTFSFAFARGLWFAGGVLGLGAFFWYLAHPAGVLGVHFRLLVTTRARFRRRVGLFVAITIPLTLAIGTINELATSDEYDGLYRTFGRSLILAQAIVFAVLLLPIAHGAGGIRDEIRKRRPQFWLVRVPRLLFYVSAFLLLVIVSFTVLGYDYSAEEIARRFALSLTVLAMCFVAYEMLRRWFVVQQRRIALEEFRRKKEQAQAEAADAPGETSKDATSAAPAAPDDSEIDLADLTEQSRRLLSVAVLIVAIVALWTIWSEVFPALNVLEDVNLWHQNVEINGETKRVPTTLADLLMFGVIVLATGIASRNVPGLLELVVLQHLPFKAGSRYATTTIVRYLIIGIGFIMAIAQLGVRWEKLQWLVASLGVGLGFGLQEIVANFISGVIILFEQPFRVGDIVTIGETTGTVSRIRMRATTIVDFDCRELVVPNKDFITGQLVNWSLSDQVTRLTISVGVAYGSDTVAARALLLECARAHPQVLDDPEPTAHFLGFGDNSLDFKLRAFLPDLNHRLEVLNDLHHAIDRACREAGIVIAFPQRDLHLDSDASITVRVDDPRAGKPNSESPQAPAR